MDSLSPSVKSCQFSLEGREQTPQRLEWETFWDDHKRENFQKGEKDKWHSYWQLEAQVRFCSCTYERHSQICGRCGKCWFVEYQRALNRPVGRLDQAAQATLQKLDPCLFLKHTENKRVSLNEKHNCTLTLIGHCLLTKLCFLSLTCSFTMTSDDEMTEKSTNGLLCVAAYVVDTLRSNSIETRFELETKRKKINTHWMNCLEVSNRE